MTPNNEAAAQLLALAATLTEGARVQTSNGPGTIVKAGAWFHPEPLCVELDCGSRFPLAFAASYLRETDNV